jgi:hypothetical protein
MKLSNRGALSFKTCRSRESGNPENTKRIRMLCIPARACYTGLGRYDIKGLTIFKI